MADKIDNSPKGKIARGVAAAEAARKGRKTPTLAHLIGQKASPENLHTLLNDCKSRLAKLVAVRDAASAALAAQTSTIQEHYATEGYVVSDSGSKEDILGDQRRRVLIEKATVAAQKAIYGAIQDDVTAHMLAVNDDLKRVASAREAVSSPLDFLMNQTLNSELRATYSANLASVGQTGLTSAAKQAIRNQDRALAAACISAIENLPARSREAMTVSRDDIAEGVIFEEFNVSADKLAVAEFVLAQAGMAAREGLGRPRSASDTLALGLKRGSAEEELGRPLTDDDVVWKPVVAGVEQSTGNTAANAAANEASAAALAAANELGEKNKAFAAAKWGSPEWVALGKELGHGVEEKNEGQTNE